MNYLDLSAKLVFKVQLGSEIKKTLIHNEDVNYTELQLMVQRIFSGKIEPNDELSIKYADEEADLITISNDADVKLALQSGKTIKLVVSLKSETVTTEPNPRRALDLVGELKQIRSRIDAFIEKMDWHLASNSVAEPTRRGESASIPSNLTWNDTDRGVKTAQQFPFDSFPTSSPSPFPLNAPLLLPTSTSLAAANVQTPSFGPNLANFSQLQPPLGAANPFSRSSSGALPASTVYKQGYK